MSKTFRKRFTSNKKRKSQSGHLTYIQNYKELERSWIFEKCAFLTINSDDIDKQKKLAFNLFHSDNQFLVNGYKKKHKSNFIAKQKAMRKKNKEILLNYDDSSEFSEKQLELLYFKTTKL